jgi:hypothetical protein
LHTFHIQTKHLQFTMPVALIHDQLLPSFSASSSPSIDGSIISVSTVGDILGTGHSLSSVHLKYSYITASFAAAAVVCILYWILCCSLTAMYFRYKTWFAYPIIFAALLETISFIARTITVHNQATASAGSFLAAEYAGLFAPWLLMMAVYRIIGRLVWYACPLDRLNTQSLLLPTRHIAIIAMSFDMVFYLVELKGAASMDVAQIEQSAGKISAAAYQAEINDVHRWLIAGRVLHLILYSAMFAFIVRVVLISRIPKTRRSDGGVFLGWGKPSTMSWMHMGLSLVVVMFSMTVRITPAYGTVADIPDPSRFPRRQSSQRARARVLQPA